MTATASVTGLVDINPIQEQRYTRESYMPFQRLVGDDNPIHHDNAYAASNKTFGRVVVPGMFLLAVIEEAFFSREEYHQRGFHGLKAKFRTEIGEDDLAKFEHGEGTSIGRWLRKKGEEDWKLAISLEGICDAAEPKKIEGDGSNPSFVMFLPAYDEENSSSIVGGTHNIPLPSPLPFMFTTGLIASPLMKYSGEKKEGGYREVTVMFHQKGTFQVEYTVDVKEREKRAPVCTFDFAVRQQAIPIVSGQVKVVEF